MLIGETHLPRINKKSISTSTVLGLRLQLVF